MQTQPHGCKIFLACVCAEPWKPGPVEAASELSTEMAGQVSEFSVASTFPPCAPRHHLPPWFPALLSLDGHFVSQAQRRQNCSDQRKSSDSRKKLLDSRQGLKVMKAWDA